MCKGCSPSFLGVVCQRLAEQHPVGSGMLEVH